MQRVQTITDQHFLVPEIVPQVGKISFYFPLRIELWLEFEILPSIGVKILAYHLVGVFPESRIKYMSA